MSERALRRHGLTLDRVTQAVRSTSLDMPGGTIKSDGGEILIRSKGQAYWGDEFADVVVLTRADGTKVTLEEVADIRDGFEEGRPLRPLQRRARGGDRSGPDRR